MLFRPVSFLIKKLQRIVNFSEFWSQSRQISTDIGRNLFVAMNTFVLLDMGSNSFGDGVMVPKNIAEYFLHNVGFRRCLSKIWGISECKFSYGYLFLSTI